MTGEKEIQIIKRLLSPSGGRSAFIFRTFIPFFLCFLLSCGGEKPTADWTFLFYFDGDNNLAEAAFNDLQELESVGSNPLVRLVVQSDFPLDFRADLAAARRFEVIQDADREKLTSPVLEYLGEADQADPRTLTDFIIWGKKRFPARRHVLVLWDHGEAWLEESAASLMSEAQNSKLKARSHVFPDFGLRTPDFGQVSPKAIFLDEDNDSGPMKNFEFRAALEASGVHFDLVIFDACIMSSLEVAYEIKDAADIMVASQELMQDSGLPYDVIISDLNQNPDQSPAELAAGIVSGYRDYCEEIYYPQGLRPDQTLSAVRLGPELSALASAVDQAGLYYLDNLPAESDNIYSARDGAEEFEFEPFRAHFYVDLYDLFSRLSPPADLASGFSEGFSRAVITEYHGLIHSRAHGLSIVFPRTPDAESNYDPTYADYDSSSGTGSPSLFMNLSWDNLLADYYRLKYPGITP